MTGPGLVGTGIAVGIVTLVGYHLGPRVLRQLSEWAQRRSDRRARGPVTLSATEAELRSARARMAHAQDTQPGPGGRCPHGVANALTCPECKRKEGQG